MKRANRPDPHRWEQDVYVGWAPWRFARWWAANKFWLLGSILILPGIGLILTGGLGLLAVATTMLVAFVAKVFRDRKRGIGFTKNNEIIIFGPHAPIVVPQGSIQSLGVMRVNRFLAMNLQGEDAEIMPDQDKWYQRMFAYAGFKSEAPIRAKDAAAAREMSLASGRGLLVVIRDRQGTFWTVSTATGYEVATLRDLAALARVSFITPGDPFGRRPAPNRNPKRQKSKRVNRARIDHLPDRDTLRDYGVHELRSFARVRAFIRKNTDFMDGQLPEQWIPQTGFLPPTGEELSLSRRRSRSTVLVTVVLVLLLVIVLPIAAMAVWPITTGGVLTASWPRPYERIWDAPPGWAITSKEADFATVTKNGEPEVLVRMGIADTDPEQDSCDSLLQDFVFDAIARSGQEIPDEPPAIVEREGWKSIILDASQSVWCGSEPNDPFVRLTSGLASNMSADEAFFVVSNTTVRINE